MPVNRYFKGEGEGVMADMKRRYGPKQGERVFYATAAKKGMTPKGKSRKKSRKR